MLRVPVESSDIVSIGYDAASRTLEVEFGGNRIYKYRDVEPDVHQQFMRAESYGDYFDTHIKRRYRFSKVTDQPRPVASALAFVTSNPRKVRDLQLACQPFGITVEGLDLPVDEIQSH